MKTTLVILGAAAVAALALNLSASAALLSPRAAGNEIIRTAVQNNDASLVASTEFAAPRATGNKVVTVAVVSAKANPSMQCAANMTASPRAIQACAGNASAPMPCCKMAAR